MNETQHEYDILQKSLPDKSLQKLTASSQNIIDYSRILDNITTPSDIMLQSYHKNT